MTKKNLKRIGMGLLCGCLFHSSIISYANPMTEKYSTENTIALLTPVNNFYKEGLHKNALKTNATAIIKQTAYISIDNANVNNKPSTSGEILFNLVYGHPINIIYHNSDWYYIASDQGNGYIYKTNLSTEKPKQYAKVNVDILNVRQKASIESNRIGKVYNGESYLVKEVLDEWVHIETGHGDGYVYKTYVDLVNQKPVERSEQVKNTSASTSNLRQQVVDFAKKFIGNRYVWGGNNLSTGVDCSGFTQQVFKHFGISLSRTSYTQINNGVRISKANLLPGDLVFYGYNNRISHVAIYIGNDQVIHARNAKYGITITSLHYNKPYIGATRVIKD